jgi:cell division protein FtsW
MYRQQATYTETKVSRTSIAVKYDIWLLGVALFIVGLGLVMVASSSVTIADRHFHDPLYYFWRQGISVLIAISLALLAMKLPMKFWEYTSVPCLIVGIFLLVLVLIPSVGREVNGSMRWIGIGPIALQASEPIKLFIVAYLAGYLVRHNESVKISFAGFIRPIGILTLIVGLLLLEPDFGAGVVLFATALGMLFMGGVPISRFIAWVTVAVVALFSLAILSPYRLQRLMSFVDPWQDPFNSGFQLTQALIAFGRGEWFGVGLGSSVQKLFYLPEAHTDFIFAVLAEELGLIGSVIVIFLYSFIIWRAFIIGQLAEYSGKLFSAYFAYGIGLIIGIQAYINLGVNMGVLPTKGLTLPLMSYGGNSIIVSCLLIGILLRIEFENRQPERGVIPRAETTYAA